MPPQLALLVCCGFVAWLFREDMKWRRLESGALWIAGIWVAIAGSRSPTYWMAYLGLGGTASSNVEGSPINFLITTALIVGALLVLRQRGLNWSVVVGSNKTLCLICLFFAVSSVWAEYPSVALRRLFKDFGLISIVLLLLTQADPGAAIRTIFVRVSFLLLPFSILFYKYYPELGRNYSNNGEQMFTGVCTFKNELGQMLMVVAFIVLWDLIELRKQEDSQTKRRQILIRYGLILMVSWLMLQAHSATSLVGVLLGLLLWWATRYLARLRSPFQIITSVLAVALCLGVLEASFQPSKILLEALGRDPTLTGRTDAWPVMIDASDKPFLGTGYRMYWDVYGGEIQEETGYNYGSAHSGYVETYLAGGLLGLTLLGLFLLAAGLRIAKGLVGGGNFGRLGLVLWVVLLVYNITESNFLWGGLLWFTFLLWAVKPPLAPSSTVVFLPSMDSDSSFEDPVRSAQAARCS